MLQAVWTHLLRLVLGPRSPGLSYEDALAFARREAANHPGVAVVLYQSRFRGGGWYVDRDARLTRTLRAVPVEGVSAAGVSPAAVSFMRHAHANPAFRGLMRDLANDEHAQATGPAEE